MFLEEYLLIDPKSSDDAETKRVKELMNHAALTYLRLQTVPQVASSVLGFLTGDRQPSQQFAGNPTPDSVALSTLYELGLGAKKTLGLAGFLGGIAKIKLPHL